MKKKSKRNRNLKRNPKRTRRNLRNPTNLSQSPRHPNLVRNSCKILMTMTTMMMKTRTLIELAQLTILWIRKKDQKVVHRLIINLLRTMVHSKLSRKILTCKMKRRRLRIKLVMLNLKRLLRLKILSRKRNQLLHVIGVLHLVLLILKKRTKSLRVARRKSLKANLRKKKRKRKELIRKKRVKRESEPKAQTVVIQVMTPVKPVMTFP